jgi:hypothetical protein
LLGTQALSEAVRASFSSSQAAFFPRQTEQVLTSAVWAMTRRTEQLDYLLRLSTHCERAYLLVGNAKSRRAVRSNHYWQSKRRLHPAVITFSSLYFFSCFFFFQTFYHGFFAWPQSGSKLLDYIVFIPLLHYSIFIEPIM